jgi:MFS family permease
MRRYLRLLRRRDYALLWVGATMSAVGDGMSFVALIWLALERTGGPGTAGWLAATYTAPVVVGGLIAGVVLDRWSRRALLVADNVVRGLAIGSLPLAALLGSLTLLHIFAVAAVYGLLFMVSLAGIPSLLPSLVEPGDLTTANAMESLSYGIAGLCGPAMAGVVITFAGAPTVLAIDAASYGAFAICLLLMNDPGDAPGASPCRRAPADPRDVATGTGGVGKGLAPAIRFVLGTPAILAITLMYMAVNIGEGMFLILAPVYAIDVLHGSAATYGLITSAFTGGTLVGALVVGALDWRFPLGRSIAAALLLTGLAFGALLAEPSPAVTAGILVLAGMLASSLTAWAQTIRMRLIPPALRGRVFALLRTLMQGTTPIGAVLGGGLLAAGALTAAICAIAAIIAVPGAIGLALPALGPMATAEPERPARAG